MSRTLNLIDILLTTGRHLVMMGRFTEALEPLTKLAGFRKLPAPVLEEFHSLRADIHLQQKNYQEARRNLAAAIALRPLEGRHHYRMALAIEEDSKANRKRAEMYYARAIDIEPDNAAYWVDFGNYLFTIDKAKEGLKAIRQAYALDTSDVDIVGQVAEVLRREDHCEEATTKLRAALFENHGSQSFRQLWQQHQFALIHRQQETKRHPKASASAKPVFLPFTPKPSQGKYVELGGKTIRIDQAEPLEEPKKRHPAPTPYKRPPKG